MSDRESWSSWHADGEALQRWVDGRAGPLTSVSVEQHVRHCPQCRSTVADLAPKAPLRRVWEQVIDEVEAPRPGLIERLLLRMGLSPSDSAVVSCAAALRTSWLLGVITVMSFALVASTLGRDGGIGLFLIGAPLVPVAGVAAAYGPSADPLYELVVSAPYATVRLVLLRTAWVLATSAPLTIGTGLLLPTPASTAVTWLLPAAGFVAVVLAASSWVDPVPVAGVVAAGWTVAVALAARAGDPLAVLRPGALLVYVAVAVLSASILLHRLLGSVPSWRLR